MPRALDVPELLLEIVSHLGQADLVQAALVCGEWSETVRGVILSSPFLYGRGGVVGRESAERTRLLVRTLTDQPGLGGQVRHLLLAVRRYRSPEQTGLYQLQSQVELLRLCPSLGGLEVEGELRSRRGQERQLAKSDSASAGDGDQNEERFVALAAIYSHRISKLSLNCFKSLNRITPYLAPFVHLTTLVVTNCDFTPDIIVGWPEPTFRLTSLKLPCDIRTRDSPRPGAEELDWLTFSSRESLVQLDLEGFTADVACDVLLWGSQLRTVRLGLVHWADRRAIGWAVDLVKLPSLVRLTLAREAPEREPEGDSDADELDGFVAGLAQAVAGANRGLGREVARVEL